MPVIQDSNFTHTLRVYRKDRINEPVIITFMSGTDTTANSILGHLWNCTLAPSEPGQWRATAHRNDDRSRIACID